MKSILLEITLVFKRSSVKFAHLSTSLPAEPFPPHLYSRDFNKFHAREKVLPRQILSASRQKGVDPGVVRFLFENLWVTARDHGVGFCVQEDAIIGHREDDNSSFAPRNRT